MNVPTATLSAIARKTAPANAKKRGSTNAAAIVEATCALGNVIA
jgi:hypothetical protein